MAVVALAVREETLGADRRNLRGSPFCARSRVAASAATILDKKIRRVLLSTFWSPGGELDNRSVPKECSLSPVKKKTRASQPHPLPPPPFPPLRIWSS